MDEICFHIPYHPFGTLDNLEQVIYSGSSASGARYYLECRDLILERFKCKEVYFTNSCTDALEFAALLLDFKEGDEIIIPSYTFVSAVTPFYLRGFKLRFADTVPERPNVSLETILPLVNNKTKAIVVMHYAGIAVDMDPIKKFAKEKKILLIEDAAQAFGACYNGRYLGTISALGAISFHETKLVSCGEGGCLMINDPEFLKRSEIIFEKGTNKKSFLRNEVVKYEWLDVGSSFGMSEFQSAVLKPQFDSLESILDYRKALWSLYMDYLRTFEEKNYLLLPDIPDFATINGTFFYIVLENSSLRHQLQLHLKKAGIESRFHYLSLHKSPFYNNMDHQVLLNSDRFENQLLRLPIHHLIQEKDITKIAEVISDYFTN